MELIYEPSVLTLQAVSVAAPYPYVDLLRPVLPVVVLYVYAFLFWKYDIC